MMRREPATRTRITARFLTRRVTGNTVPWPFPLPPRRPRAAAFRGRLLPRHRFPSAGSPLPQGQNAGYFHPAVTADSVGRPETASCGPHAEDIRRTVRTVHTVFTYPAWHARVARTV